MKVTVLGTGMVGQAQAAKLDELGHEVVVGTHDIQKTMAKEDGQMTQAYSHWAKAHPKVKLMVFADAAKHGELIIEALSGQGALEVLASLKGDLAGKVLIDISNPLDFSKGRPPTLSVCNDNSLGEQIQAILPDTKVVKAFNTMNASIQTNPQELASGDHQLFICGNYKSAKAEVTKLAKSYGWKNILDLGDIKSARGMEMILPIWLQIMVTLGTPQFNFKIAQ